MYDEDDLLPLSALQHLVFCERQCALIHVEQVWVESVSTFEGRTLHERVDAGGEEARGAVRTARALPLVSRRLGLTGRADLVELHLLAAAAGHAPSPDAAAEPAASAPGALPADLAGRWQPYPVEYKRGRPKSNRCDEVQLCAQALCLEEMLATPVPAGALFYATVRRRTEVVFDRELRATTERAAARLHQLFAAGETPPAVREPKCDSCSLLDVCLPAAPKRSARRYLERLLAGEEDGDT